MKKLAETQHSENQDHDIWSQHFKKIDGRKMETVADFFILGSKITADSDCTNEIKRHLFLGRKVKTNLAYWKADITFWQSDVSVYIYIHIYILYYI